MNELTICSHCKQPLRGHGSVTSAPGEVDELCHPNEGMDCYHLVTLYKHPMPCWSCIRYVAGAPPAAYVASRSRFEL